MPDITFEGQRQPRRIIMLEFPGLERPKQWFDSPEDALAPPIRQRYSRSTKVIAVEGL